MDKDKIIYETMKEMATVYNRIKSRPDDQFEKGYYAGMARALTILMYTNDDTDCK